MRISAILIFRYYPSYRTFS